MAKEVKIKADAPTLKATPSRGGGRIGVQRQTQIPQRKATAVFTRKCKELKGYIFDFSDWKQVD